jgi:hypothetical protein
VRAFANTTEFCAKCGAIGIARCPECKDSIRGAGLYYGLHGDWTLGGHLLRPPAYCPRCGKPFPWTKLALEAAEQLVLEMDELSRDEKASLTSSFSDLVRDTPTTPVAMARYKKLIANAAEGSKQALKEIMVAVVVDSVKRGLFSSP